MVYTDIDGCLITVCVGDLRRNGATDQPSAILKVQGYHLDYKKITKFCHQVASTVPLSQTIDYIGRVRVRSILGIILT